MMPNLRTTSTLWLTRCQQDGKSPATLSGYRGQVATLIKVAGGYKLDSMTPKRFSTIDKSLIKIGKSVGTRRNILATACAITKHAQYEELIPVAPITYRKPSGVQGTRTSFSNGQIDSLLRACHTPRERLAISLGLMAGLRLSEARLVNPADSQGGILRVLKTKNKKPRSIPIPKQLSGLIESVQPHPGGSSICPPGWTTNTPCINWLNPIYARAGVPYGYHRLRHTWASKLANESRTPITPTMLMRWGGWSSPSMVARYYHNPEFENFDIDEVWGD